MSPVARLLGGGAGGALGGFLGAAGIGVGAATAGLGVLMAGGGFLLEKLAEFDGEAVKKNILALTDIGDELVAKSGSMTQAFKDGATDKDYCYIECVDDDLDCNAQWWRRQRPPQHEQQRQPRQEP